ATLTDPAMQNSAEYRLAIEPLRRILASAPELTYIYTAVLDGETVRFVLDAAEPGDHDGDGRDDHAKIGEPYVNAEPLIYYALTAHGGKGAVVTSAEPYEDVWGSFLTGYAPFYNADGTLAGVAGVDISANRYLAEVAEQRHAVLLGLI